MQIDEIEALLTRELHEVADGVDVPLRPEPGTIRVAPGRVWMAPLAAAIAVLLVLAGVTLFVTRQGDDRGPAGIPKGAPAIPFVVGGTLYVGGKAMPGRWLSVVSAGDSWIAARRGSGWWWGRGTHEHRAAVAKDTMPILSRDGAVIALPQAVGKGRVQVRDTTDGRLLGTWRLPHQNPADGLGLVMAAVTSPDVRVFRVGGNGTAMWTLATGQTRQLKDLSVIGDTPAGMLIAQTVGQGPIFFRLGSIGPDGRAAYTAMVPDASAGTFSDDGWMAVGKRNRRVRAAAGGEVEGATRIEVRELDPSRRLTLSVPAGWIASTFAWEAPGTLIADVLPAGTGPASPMDTRLMRCVISLRRCALTD